MNTAEKTAVDTYLDAVMTCIEYYKLSDKPLDFDFMQLGVSNGTASIRTSSSKRTAPSGT